MGHEWPVHVEDESTGEWVGEHRQELIDLVPLFASLVRLDVHEATADDWRAHLAPQFKLVQVLGPRTAHIRAKGSEVPNIVVRLDPPRPPGLRWLADRHSPARARYLWAHRLRAVGIDTARPLGYIEHAKDPAGTRSFVASEYLFAPSLIQYRDEKIAAGLSSDAVLEKRRLLRAVADLTRELHAHGLFPAELSGRQLAVDGAAVRLADAGQEAPRRTKDRAARNLASLHRDFATAVTRTDRLRFVRSYLRHAPSVDPRRLFAAIDAASV